LGKSSPRVFFTDSHASLENSGPVENESVQYTKPLHISKHFPGCYTDIVHSNLQVPTRNNAGVESWKRAGEWPQVRLMQNIVENKLNT